MEPIQSHFFRLGGEEFFCEQLDLEKRNPMVNQKEPGTYEIRVREVRENLPGFNSNEVAYGWKPTFKLRSPVIIENPLKRFYLFFNFFREDCFGKGGEKNSDFGFS